MSKTNSAKKLYIQLGASLLTEGKYEEAERVYRQAIELESDHAWSYCNLGRSLLHQGKIEEAIPYLQTAVKLEPNMAEAYYNLGDACTKQNSFEGAVGNYRKAIELEQGNFLYCHHLGDVFLIQQQYEEAVNHYRKAIELNSDYAWSYCNLGKALSALEEWEKARAAYKQAIELNPEVPSWVYENLGEILTQQTQKNGKVDTEINGVKDLAVSLEDPLLDDRLVLWIGRFSKSSGYGYATKSYYEALELAKVPVVAIDINLLQVVGGPISQRVKVTQKSDNLAIEPVNPDVNLIVIFHDTPEKLARLRIKGRSRLICFTVFETASLPFPWYDPLVSVDEIWTASHFNKQTFSSAGIPGYTIQVMPHCHNTELYGAPCSKLSLPHLNSFVFLNVVSNFNRKDMGLLLRSYFKAFRSTEDVSLIVKLPPSLNRERYDKYIQSAVWPEFDLNSPDLPHVVFLVGHLSDERMRNLYATGDVYVSLERGKGWDLPATQAMALGKPVVGINWSANREFMNPENSYLIEPLSAQVFVEEDLVDNLELYTGHKWSGVNEDDVVKTLREAWENQETRQVKGLKAQQDIQNKFSLEVIGERMAARIAQYVASDFKTHTPAKMELHKSALSPVKHKHEIVLAKDLEPFKPEVGVDAWIAERRKIWGACNGVAPVEEELSRLRSLKNAFYGKRIFIVGNGPSLNKINLDRLQGEYTFAANKIYLLFDKVKWRPTFYTCLDWRVGPDISEMINTLRDGMTFFLPNRFYTLLQSGEDVFWYHSKSPGETIYEKFETDITQGVRGGGTILVAAIQIAFYLGFREMYLIGVDASYSIPKTVIQSGPDKFGNGVKLNLESTEDDDLNHFDPRYFGKGTKWHDPNVNEMVRGFANCRKAIEIHGGKIYNATVGGKLEVLERGIFDDLF